MKTIYLHIGTMKTGTTAIQDFLAENQEALERHGYSYPLLHIGPTYTYDRRNAHFMVYKSPKQNAEERREDVEKIHTRGIKMVYKAAEKVDNIILSDEMLWYEQNKNHFWDHYFEAFPEDQFRLKVIVYLRRQDDYVESYWNQKVKGTSRYEMTFQEYLESSRYKGILLDYDLQIQEMLRHIRRDQLIVRVYENGQYEGAQGNLLSDFFHSIDTELTEDYKNPEQSSNQNISDNFIELKRILNMLPDYKDTDNFYRVAMLGAAEAVRKSGQPSKKWTMFDPEVRKAFLEQYQEGNAWVAREILGREDGVMFRKPLPDLPVWEFEPKTVSRDVMLFLAEADIYQQRKILSVKDRVKVLEKDAARTEALEALKETVALQKEQMAALEEQLGKLRNRVDQLEKKNKTMYNSLIFRLYRKVRSWFKKE